MAYFDVFNGDADGICALLQLRQHTPRSATIGDRREARHWTSQPSD